MSFEKELHDALVAQAQRQLERANELVGPEAVERLLLAHQLHQAAKEYEEPRGNITSV